ncbi:MAG: hypothetical protein QGG34_10225 [SAR202 cluster bacterium]|jgi:hypothetical protein|nr:hypothetical protein [SAR202 cluster bacterium]MDP6300227.1 hypothetical protein [SAR202 cluster bacterium]MDP7103307.1 hypothetical protein [SAR202 cluster bacterium]MDP7224777.1 hypothetical protein [SAR202 cluster bacterium]MDP7412751.1 hypothetical protein [SAR202 cluster bacterium]|tara:strand:+ start:7780 stop:8271 length:492 start_codon:yes stop_codon:yes gene_type:complete
MGWSKHHKFGLIHKTPAATYRGYTILTVSVGDQAMLVDMDGRVCHRWQYDGGISYARVLPGGNLLLRAKATGDDEMVRGLGGSAPALVELDWDSNKVWEYNDPMLHHDYARLPNGNTLALLFEAMSPEESAAVKGGYASDEDPDQMLGDIVREIAPDGETLNE